MEALDLENIRIDLSYHPLTEQIVLLKLALLNEEQSKLIDISFDSSAAESDLLADANLSGLGLRNSSALRVAADGQSV